jgi:hypothetical protein
MIVGCRECQGFDDRAAQTARNALICYIFFEYTTIESAVTPKGLSLAAVRAADTRPSPISSQKRFAF